MKYIILYIYNILKMSQLSNLISQKYKALYGGRMRGGLGMGDATKLLRTFYENKDELEKGVIAFKNMFKGGKGTKAGAEKNSYIKCLKSNKGKKGVRGLCVAESKKRKRKPNTYIECLKANKGQKGSRAKCLSESKKRLAKSGATQQEIKKVEQVVEKTAEKITEKLTENLPITPAQEAKVEEKVKEVIEKAIVNESLKKDEEKILEVAQKEVPEVKETILLGNGLLMGGCYDSDDEKDIHIHLGGKKRRGGAGVYGNGYKRNGRRIRKDKGKKKTNTWIKHVQMMAKKLRIPYNEAIADDRVKKSYYK